MLPHISLYPPIRADITGKALDELASTSEVQSSRREKLRVQTRLKAFERVGRRIELTLREGMAFPIEG